MQGTTNIARDQANSNAGTTAPAGATRIDTRGRTVLVMGAWSGAIGAVLAFVANGLHPHPNDFRLESLLQAIGQNN